MCVILKTCVKFKFKLFDYIVYPFKLYIKFNKYILRELKYIKNWIIKSMIECI